jgi:uncharacterized membrane protein
MEFEWAKYGTVALASTVKFVGGPITGLALGLTWWETGLASAVGMMLSVLVFTFLERQIERILRRYRRTTPRRFTWINRLAIRVWQRFGLVGIACLTPVIFTPIGGTLLANAFHPPLGRMFAWMLFFGLFWGQVMTWAFAQLPNLRSIFGWVPGV